MYRVIRKLFRWVPPFWKGKIEYLFDQSLGKEFGGPFNGQEKRQQIFRDLVGSLEFEAIVETGTFRGTTTAFMAKESGLPVFTVESEPRFYYYAKMHLRREKKVHVTLGDSREFIEFLANRQLVPKQNVFFYLDAHWNADLPLYKEIELIGEHWKNSVIMIDDFKVPGDAGYKYDDYGEGKSLCLEYIMPLLDDQWSVFFPAADSSKETSIRRGSVILVNKAIENKLLSIDSLRQFNPKMSSIAQ